MQSLHKTLPPLACPKRHIYAYSCTPIHSRYSGYQMIELSLLEGFCSGQFHPGRLLDEHYGRMTAKRTCYREATPRQRVAVRDLAIHRERNPSLLRGAGWSRTVLLLEGSPRGAAIR
jgi:hypothetical protein